MRYFKYLLILILILGCSTHYLPTSRTKPGSEVVDNISYSLSKVSDPTSPQNPYLVLNCQAKGIAIKTTYEEFLVKHRISSLLTFWLPLLGVGSGAFLYSRGYRVAGRDLIGLSLISSISMLTYNGVNSRREWKESQEKRPLTYKPTKPFKVKLRVAKNYKDSIDITPDKDGNLSIDIRQFLRHYKPNQAFSFIIFSPANVSLGEYSVDPEMIREPYPITVVDTGIPVTNLKNPDGVAVIIGVKDYEYPGVPSVDFALRDAALVKEYLIKTLGYQPDNIIYLENPKKSDLEIVFGTEKDYQGKLFDYVKPHKSDVFIYYIGHGAPDIQTKSGYFVPVDCHPDYVRLNGYALETFYKNLSQIPAKSITVIIDACFSGTSEKGSILTAANPLIDVKIEKRIGSNINLFTSCGSEEISSWYKEAGHNLFTYFFLNGLRGEADKNKDKNITFGEMKEYVVEKVRYYAQRLYGRRQNPTFQGDEKEVLVSTK